METKMPKNIIVVALKSVLLYQNKVLILQRADTLSNGAGIWEFPGGKLEFDESLPQAMLREIQEETGIPATIERLLYVADLKTHPHRQVVIINYLCNATTNAVTLSHEHQNYLWATREEMLTLLDPVITQNLQENNIFAQLNL